MIDEHSRTLWARVCATVNRLGQPRSQSQPTVAPLHPPADPTTIDLHGMTLFEAWRYVREFIADTRHRDVTIITGKGRMATELPDWLWSCPRYQSVQTLNGGGAFRVRVKPR